MPTYTYECSMEHHTKLIQHMSADRPETAECKICGRAAKRIFLRTTQTQKAFAEYLTLVGDNKHKLVADAAQEREIENRHKVAHMTDADMKRMRENMKSDYEKTYLTDRQEPMEVTVNEVLREQAQWGTEYRREQEEKTRNEMAYDADFERELRAGHVND
jgi:predicted nucleic acid-binding Zn ribbon protein